MKTNKKIISTIIVFLLTLILFGCVDDSNTRSVVESSIDGLNRSDSGFRLFYYGKEEELLHLNVTYVQNLDEIVFNKAYKHTFIVINNLDNKLSFDVDELTKLYENSVANHYSLYYFGDTHIDKFYQSGFYSREAYIDSYELKGFSYVLEGNRYLVSSGNWTQKEVVMAENKPTLFIEVLMVDLEFTIKRQV